MYTDISTNADYPKTLVIRNHEGAMIIYHIQKEYEAKRLSDSAARSGFETITLEDYCDDYEETFPDWRDNAPHITEE